MKRLARRSLNSLASSVATSSHTSDVIIGQVSRSIRDEMKTLCSMEHDSILRDCNDGIKFFSWETVYAELVRMMPTFMKILSIIITGNESKKKVLMCIISSIVLKSRMHQMSLVQRAISVLLYGNGCTKEVLIK